MCAPRLDASMNIGGCSWSTVSNSNPPYHEAYPHPFATGALGRLLSTQNCKPSNRRSGHSNQPRRLAGKNESRRPWILLVRRCPGNGPGPAYYSRKTQIFKTCWCSPLVPGKYFPTFHTRKAESLDLFKTVSIGTPTIVA